MLITRDNRNLLFTEVPAACGFKDMPTTLTVVVSYAEQSCATNGIQLDNAILPLLAASAEMLEVLERCADFMGSVANSGRGPSKVSDTFRQAYKDARAVIAKASKPVSP